MASPATRPPARHRRKRQAAWAIAGVLLLYLALAYLLVPELWILRDRSPARAVGSFVTETPQGIPGDPINVGLVGTREDMVRAFLKAGWHPADALTLRTAAEIGESVLLDRSYPDAPVSTLTYEGRRQDMAFEKPDGKSPDRRHHVRFWKAGEADAVMEDLWLGAASFDRGVGLSHDTGQVTHHIAPDVDAERDLIIADLEAASALASVSTMEGVGATRDGRNGGGDPYFTDGRIRIGTLNGGR